ncbi:MAG: 1-acyl-sn-glycerol-3-phosphate acyltransferase [Clostridia bacterium]|nr:1-acyl-sn-glycerol-3-phosphate acyltransferase [Clostridia bacterium]
MKQKVIYYTDEHNDEFSKAKITPKKIDGGYKYIRNRFLSGFLYNVVARPLAYAYTKLKYAQKTVGRDKLRPYLKQGLFIYGNHTQAGGDPLIPNVFCFPKKVYFVVHPNNVSMPVFGAFMPYLGALPLPDNMAAYRNFLSAVSQRTKEGAAVVIYPEAHIWPYYTGIRDFPETSFGYPCRENTPVFCFTNTYKKRKVFKRPKIITYIDGPFFPDESRPLNKRTKTLRDEVYNTMCERSKLSDCEYIRYIKKET